MKTNVCPACLAILLLILTFGHLARAQNNTGTGPNGKVVTTNGTDAALSITTGIYNTAYGYFALRQDKTGSRNVAIGSLSLQANVGGSYNTAVGYGALTVNLADNNTALGNGTLAANTNGANNVAVGHTALNVSTTGGLNTALGVQALRYNTSGASNLAGGFQALYKNTTGGFNVALGDGALYNNTTGSGNIAIGEDGGFSLTTGNSNISIGHKGVAGEAGKIRIGTTGRHTDTYLVGIIHGDGSGLTNVTAEVPVPLVLNAARSGAILSGTNTGTGHGVYGQAGTATGVWGKSTSGTGVMGSSSSGFGVYGTSNGADTAAIFGDHSGNGDGVTGRANGVGRAGIHGIGNSTNQAGHFDGAVSVIGDFSATGMKSFKIDHPLDPANKYLVHAAIESPDVKNLYDGIITTDGNGDATIVLPGYFEALNRDFRYQLTVLGQFARAMVAREIAENQFAIKTDQPNVRVSWQVTGIRRDAYAAAHPMTVEPDKPAAERGTYQHPALFHQPEEKGLSWKQDPEMWKRVREERIERTSTDPARRAAPQGVLARP